MGTAPIADGLFLTNFLQSVEESTNNDLETLEDIVQVEVLNPYLTISKGAVASTSPDAQFSPRTTGPVTFNGPGAGTPFNGVINSDGLAGAPIDSDLTGVQPGDIISFAVVIENLGSSPKGAFDIIVRDLLPDGMQIPPGGLNLQVRLGNGVEVNWQGVNNGGADDFFGGGIELTDPGIDTGVCGPYNGQDGTNIIIITYDLMLLDPPENVLENTSTIITYSSGEGGGDHTGEQDREDSSLITFSGGGSGGGDGGSGDGGSGGGGGGEVIIDKQIVTPFALPGEPVTWVIDVTNNGGVPVPNVEVVDNIPGGIEVRNATTTAGTVSVDGSSYRITIDTLAPGQTVTVTINARVGADVEPPYIITNEALLLIGGAQVAADDSSVVSVNQLAATGESNGLRWVVLIALLSGGTLIGLGYLTVRRSRR